MPSFSLKLIAAGILSLAVSSCRPQLSHEDLLSSRIADARPAVVQLVTQDSSCSAFYVGQDLFITASHCIRHGEDHVIIDMNDEPYAVKIILVDRDRDVTVFESASFDAAPLQLWNEKLYGFPKVGAALVTMGFPGYYLKNFVFEEGRLLDKGEDNGVKMLISRGISYPGESGGPVISLHNGQVVGLVHALAERITPVGEDVQVHNTLSLLIAWPELQLVLEQARKLR